MTSALFRSSDQAARCFVYVWIFFSVYLQIHSPLVPLPLACSWDWAMGPSRRLEGPDSPSASLRVASSMKATVPLGGSF